MTKKVMISIMMIIMSTHLLHLKSDENHHDASSASPAVIMISMTTHRLHLQSGRIYAKDEDDDKEGDDINHDDNHVHASLASQIG